MFDTLYSITITQAAAALRAGELTSAALVRHALEAVRLHDGTLNAMLRVSASALEEAERCDAEAAQGSFRGPLHGIPLVIKDNIDVRGLPTTVASPLFTHAAPAKADAVAVARLRAAGAVIFGKTNLDELAAHVSGRTSCFGPTVNPWHPERRLSPGGSSSGTAAAVAAGYCPGGLGTDTGGSIRLPAGWCGLYGIRSTQGQSDISGIYPRAASLDTVGAMARSARDIDLLLQILADPPLRDTLRASAPIRYLRIGVFPDLVRAKGSPEVIEAYAEAVGRWEEFGECIPVGLPLLDDPAVVDSGPSAVTSSPATSGRISKATPSRAKCTPCRWPTTRMANRRRPKPTTPPCSTSRLFLGRSTPSSPRSKWIFCCCRWPSPPPRP